MAHVTYDKVVSFDPAKHRDQIVTATNTKRAVKLVNVKYSDSREGFGKKDIKINHWSSVEWTFLKFEYKIKELIFANIDDIELMPNSSKVNVRVRVLKEGLATTFNDHAKQDKVICDNSGFITLAVWEDQIAMIDVSKYYEITEVRLKETLYHLMRISLMASIG